MNKKKAIKIATATAIAASGFVAVAPSQSQAAANVPAEVIKAKKVMYDAMYTYSKPYVADGTLTSRTVVYAAYKKGEAQYKYAVNVLKYEKDAKIRAAYKADLDKVHNTYLLGRALNYIKTLNALELQVQPAAKKLDAVVASANVTEQQIKDAQAEFKKVYDAQQKDLAAVVESNIEATVKQAAKASYDKSNAAADKKAEEVSVPKVVNVSAIANVEINEGAELKLPETVEVTLVSGAKAQKAVKWDTTAVDTKKAGEYAATGTVADTTLKASVKVVVKAVAPAVSSVSAINAKSLKVKFNHAVDTTKATFEVKKGSVKVNTYAVTWNADKTEATVELSGKLTAGSYTVNVTGLAASTLTGSVTAENEKVASVTILSDKAAIAVTPASSTGTVTVGYKVENQYGEDITSTTALTASAGGTVVRTGTTTAVRGLVTIPVTDAAKEGDSIVLTLVNTESGKAASQTVKVSTKAAVSDIAITGLYNKDGKKLTETTDLNKDAFYLLVEAKDQYGQTVKPSNITGIIGNNTNTSVVGINGVASPTIETIQVDGKDVAAVKLTGPVKAGETSVMLIAPASGKNATYTVNVAEAQRADSIVFEVPSVVAANEELFVPVQVTDKSGNSITDEKTLKDTTRGVTLSGVANAEFTTKNGVLGVLVPKASLTTEGYVSLVGVTSTAKSTIANIQVKAAAAPAIVTGLTSETSTTLLVNGTLDISPANLVVEDQYGRVMTKATLDAWLDAAPNNKIIVEDTTAGIATLASGNETQITASTITNTATVTGKVKGNEKVTITISKDGNKVATSAKEVNLQVTDGSEYASYAVDTVGTVYDEVGAGKSVANAYHKVVKVYGVLSNGSKVLLNNGTDYSVSSTNAAFNTDVAADGTVDVNAAQTYAQNQTEVKLPLTVTINKTGEKLSQEVTISKVAPKVAKLEIVKDGDVSKKSMTATSAIDYNTAAAFDFSKLAGAVDVVVTDQYDVKTELTSASTTFADTTAIASTLTYTKVDGSLVFAKNGSGTASVTEIPAKSIFNVVVGAGELTSSPLKVTATSAFSLATATTVNGVSVVGTDGFTPVTSPKAGDKLTANIKILDGSTIGTYPVNTNAKYNWHYVGSDAVLGTDSSYTVTSDNEGKKISVDVSVNGYTGTATWTATTAVPDQTAPSVKTKLPAAATFNADATQTLVFSEALNAASQTAVKDAVELAYTKTGSGKAVGTWNTAGDTLTVTITADSNNTVALGAPVATAVTDAAGNTSAALDLQ